MAQVNGRQESRDEALVRLAGEARRHGVAPLFYAPANEAYVASRSEVGMLHRVTAVSCDCRGHQYRGYCIHLAALLDALGWLPGSPEPTTLAVRVPEVPCADCRGDGWWYGSTTDSRHTVISCGVCHGSGVEPATALAA